MVITENMYLFMTKFNFSLSDLAIAKWWPSIGTPVVANIFI